MVSDTISTRYINQALLTVLLSKSDEELPDYIMVMVANKKTSEQMADDLSLFLGNNTVKFTAWYEPNSVF